jgi:hypothetical protein
MIFVKETSIKELSSNNQPSVGSHTPNHRLKADGGFAARVRRVAGNSRQASFQAHCQSAAAANQNFGQNGVCKIILDKICMTQGLLILRFYPIHIS